MIVAAERKVLSARSHKHEDKLVRLGKHDDRDTTISERPLKISALVVQDLQMSKKCPSLFHSHVLCFMSFNIPLIGTKHRLSLSPNVIENCSNCFKQHVSYVLPPQHQEGQTALQLVHDVWWFQCIPFKWISRHESESGQVKPSQRVLVGFGSRLKWIRM